MLKKTCQTNNPVSSKLLHCVMSGAHTHYNLLQSFSHSFPTQEFGYHSRMCALIQWSCVTLNQTASKSLVWERAVRYVIWGLCPWLRGCIWSQAPAVSHCLCCITDMAVPACFLCWSWDCFLIRICGLASDLSRHYCFCVIWYFVIQQAVESVNSGLLWILICYNYSPPPRPSFTQKAAELPSLRLQELTYSKSLSFQNTLAPHLHHASKSLMVCSLLSFFLCWNE